MSNEIVPAYTESTELAETTANYIQGDINTFDLTTNEGKLGTLAAINNAESLNGHEGEVLEVVDCITMPGIRKSRDPRLPDTPCTNTYLVLRNGKVLMSQSTGVERSVRTIAAMFPDFGKNTLPDGFIPLAFIAKDLANGNTIKNLVPQI